MNEEQYTAIREELARNAQEHKSYGRRLDEHDKSLEKLTETQIQLVNLTNAVNNLTAGVKDMKSVMESVDSRVSAIEKEPADKWKRITWEIIKAVVLAVAGVAIGYFIKAIGG